MGPDGDDRLSDHEPNPLSPRRILVGRILEMDA